MSVSFFRNFIYLLGFIGLAAIGLLLLRTWQVVSSTIVHKSLSFHGKFLTGFALLVVLAALWSEVKVVVRIFRCLTETYCGPSVASGWIYLAALGAVYLFVEIAIFVLNKVQARATSL
ncbi:hypothetical protein DOQ73_22960 [Salmonella enterica subsp. enterica]|nr:hypothetical protein [Salmonella enterica subsp. enterica serovar Javiana]